MWIDIFERQPDFGKPVLVWMTQSLFKFVSVCYLSEGLCGLKWVICGHNYPIINEYPFDYATHWHEIPDVQQIHELNKDND